MERGQALVVAVAEIVATEKDPSRLEELLELSDRLNGLIKDLVRSQFSNRSLNSIHSYALV